MYKEGIRKRFDSKDYPMQGGEKLRHKGGNLYINTTNNKIGILKKYYNQVNTLPKASNMNSNSNVKHSKEINEKLNSWNENISALKERWIDVNRSNSNLKALIREKSPGSRDFVVSYSSENICKSDKLNTKDKIETSKKKEVVSKFNNKNKTEMIKESQAQKVGKGYPCNNKELDVESLGLKNYQLKDSNHQGGQIGKDRNQSWSMINTCSLRTPVTIRDKAVASYQTNKWLSCNSTNRNNAGKDNTNQLIKENTFLNQQGEGALSKIQNLKTKIETLNRKGNESLEHQTMKLRESYDHDLDLQWNEQREESIKYIEHIPSQQNNDTKINQTNLDEYTKIKTAFDAVQKQKIEISNWLSIKEEQNKDWTNKLNMKHQENTELKEELETWQNKYSMEATETKETFRKSNTEFTLKVSELEQKLNTKEMLLRENKEIIEWWNKDNQRIGEITERNRELVKANIINEKIISRLQSDWSIYTQTIVELKQELSNNCNRLKSFTNAELVKTRAIEAEIIKHKQEKIQVPRDNEISKNVITEMKNEWESKNEKLKTSNEWLQKMENEYDITINSLKSELEIALKYKEKCFQLQEEVHWLNMNILSWEEKNQIIESKINNDNDTKWFKQELESKLSEQSKHLIELKNSDELNQGILVKYEEENRNLKDRIILLEDSMSQLEEINKQLNVSFKERTSTYTAAMNTNQEQIEIHVNKIENLESENSELKHKISVLDKEKTMWTSDNEQLKCELLTTKELASKELEEAILKYKNEWERMRWDNEHNRQEISELILNKEKLQSEWISTKSALCTADERVKNYTEQVRILNNDIENNKNQINDLTNERDETLIKCNAVTEGVRTWTTNLINKNEEIKILNNQITTLELRVKSINDIQPKLKELHHPHFTQHKHWSTQLTTQFQFQFQLISKEKSTIDKGQNIKPEEIQSIISDNKWLKEQWKDYKIEIDNIQQTFLEQKNISNTLIKELNSKENIIQELTHQIVHSKDLREKAEEICLEWNQTKGDLDAIKKHDLDNQNRIREWEEKNRKHISYNEEWNCELTKKEKEISAIKVINMEVLTLKGKWEEDIARMNDEIEGERVKNNENIKDLNNIINEKQRIISAKQDNITAMTKENESWNRVISAWHEENDKITKMNKEFESKIIQLDDKISSFELKQTSSSGNINVDARDVKGEEHEEEANNITTLGWYNAKFEIEIKTLQEALDEYTVKNQGLNEEIIRKDLEWKESEDRHREDLNTINKINKDLQELTGKFIESPPTNNKQISDLQAKLKEKEEEIESYKSITDMLTATNNELSMKVNNKDISQWKRLNSDKINNNDDDVDKEDFISWQIKNESWNEIIKAKEEEILELQKQLDNYKTEVSKILNKSEVNQGWLSNNINKSKDSFSSLSNIDTINQVNLKEALDKYKEIHKEQKQETDMLNNQLQLLKGDIKNYKMQITNLKNEKAGNTKNNTLSEGFKTKVMTVLELYKPKKKEHLDIVKELKEELGCCGIESGPAQSEVSNNENAVNTSAKDKKGFFSRFKK